MSEYLTSDGILRKAKESKIDFLFKTKLQVVEQIVANTRAGNPYLKLVLRDNYSEIRNVTKWINDDEDLIRQRTLFEIGNVLEIQGKYDKRFGPNITNARVLTPEEFKIEDFTETSSVNNNELVKVLFEIISSIHNKKLKELLEMIFSDTEVKKKFIESPSSIKYHHAYKFGNLEHTVGMLKIFQQLEKYYNRGTKLSVDLIYTGIILHDIGKIFEYSIYNGVPRYIEGSELHGHLVLGAQLVTKYMNKIKDFPNDLKNRIRHLILSHHGKKEWDSVVKPQIDEAEILHYLDMIDSRFKLR